MIPILYESNETTYTNNGLARLRDCLTFEVSEERNSIFEADFTYPVGGANFDLIQPGRIVLATHDDTGDTQPFDIVSYSKPIDGIVTFHAVHISYRQRGMTVSGKNINSLSDAFTLLASAQPSNPFTYTASFTSSAFMAAADGVPKTVKSMLGGVEGSILDTYGGEYTWDRFNVRLDRQRGQVRDFTIRYGLNLLDYLEDMDYQEAYTSVIPYWTGTDNNGATIVVKASRVDSGLPAYNGRNDCVPLDLTDKFENKPTAAQLRTEAATYLSSHQPNIGQQTITVDFVRLQDLGEFDQFESLLTCRLCDSISVVFPEYGMSGVFKIVKTVYNVLEERYIEMQLGSLSTTLSEALGLSGGGTFTETSGYPTPFTPTRATYSGTASNFTSGTTLKSLGVSETLSAGFWIIIAEARYASNSTGYRSIQITADGTGQNATLVQTPARGTGNVDLQTVATIEKSAAWVLDVNGRQNSGSAMNVEWYVQAMKVGEAT